MRLEFPSNFEFCDSGKGNIIEGIHIDLYHFRAFPIAIVIGVQFSFKETLKLRWLCLHWLLL